MLKASKNSISHSLLEILLIMVHLEAFSKGIPQKQPMEPDFKSGGLGEPWNKGINKNERMEVSSGRHSR